MRLRQPAHSFDPSYVPETRDSATDIWVSDIVSALGHPSNLTVFNNALYFNAYDDILGDTLFRLDAGSTTPVAVVSRLTLVARYPA